ncbi:uncharacterized protein LOC144707516 [Wolffia australiana]
MEMSMELVMDVLLCVVLVWLAVMIGLVIGWSWRPRWAGLVFLGLGSRVRFAWLWSLPLGFGAHRLWLAFTALSAFSLCRSFWAKFKRKEESSSAILVISDVPAGSEIVPSAEIQEESCGSESEQLRDSVTEKDLDHFLLLLDNNNGAAVWHHMMERTTPNMTYQAWRYEPEGGPVVYRSRTVFEDANPELVRDFFWDDDFRLKWDHMLSHFELLKEFPCTGISVVHWIKKFPFFCSDREYIIGRRIWESGDAYYCVTKGIEYPWLQKKDKPRRVDLYFSSWRVRAVPSSKQDGNAGACEVTLVHYEDMGIPKDVAKIGVRHGMWGAVKKLQSGLRSYQINRKNELTLSRSAQLAHYTTKIPISAPFIATNVDGTDLAASVTIKRHGIDWKWVAVGGAVAVVCGVQTGVIGKALVLGVARRLARR